MCIIIWNLPYVAYLRKENSSTRFAFETIYVHKLVEIVKQCC